MTPDPPPHPFPPAPPLGDLPPAEFRAHLHRVADWIADYREGIERFPISPSVRPGEIAESLAKGPPERGEAMEAILADLDRVVMPGVVHWGHPAFLGYFGSTTTAPGILAEMIAAALNVSAMTWRTSPAATELETGVLGWIREMVGLPPEFTGVVYDIGSVATLHALAAAREAAGFGVRARGLAGRREVPPLRVYASDQAHSSVEKAAITLGLGEESVRRVASDAEFRMVPEALRQAIEEDARSGARPLATVATVGTTSTASVDPVIAIAKTCREHGVWLHVDAAYGGAMGLLPEGRWAMRGVERADSIVINPHKWLFVPLDFSTLFVRRPELLREVFALTPEYLRGDAGTAERDPHQIDYMDYGVQLGRRFRALKAWMVFRAFGREGIAARIREHLRLAQLLASWIEADPNFELAAPVVMAVVCFRARIRGEGEEVPPGQVDDFNERIVEAVNATGRAYLTHTRLRARVVMRVGIGNVLTTEAHLREAWNLIREEAARASP